MWSQLDLAEKELSVGLAKNQVSDPRPDLFDRRDLHRLLTPLNERSDLVGREPVSAKDNPHYIFFEWDATANSFHPNRSEDSSRLNPISGQWKQRQSPTQKPEVS